MILPVKTASGGYDIALVRGALSHLGDYLPHAGRALIVTDDGVPAEYARAAASVCENSACCLRGCWSWALRARIA